MFEASEGKRNREIKKKSIMAKKSFQQGYFYKKLRNTSV